MLHNHRDENSPAGAEKAGEGNGENSVNHQDDGEDDEEEHGGWPAGGGRTVFQA